MLTGGTEVSSERGVVCAGHPLAVEAGLGILDAGGTAVDATIAAAFVSFVAEPNNAGIGGYGHLSAFLPDRGGFLTVDHGPRAPHRARPDMFRLVQAPAPAGYDWPEVVDDRNAIGHLAPATPGAVAGLSTAHECGGRLPWARLLEPAIELAECGLEVNWALLLEIAGNAEQIRARPALAELLMPAGRLPRARDADRPGERLDQRALAVTLRRIAAAGPAALSTGELAAAIASEVRAGDGILDADDLASYGPKLIAESPSYYRDLAYVTANDQVGYETLGILDRFPLNAFGPGSAQHFHLLAEAMGHAFVDNVTYAGDPDITRSPLAGLSSTAFAAARADGIAIDRIAPRPVRSADPWPFEPGGETGPHPAPSAGGARGTTQIVTADSEGNLVALITTIGGDFGSFVLVPETGILLNNSMINYDPRPGRANSIAPGKMPFFAVPAIVATRAGRAAFAAAGSGGYPILAGVINTMVNHVDHGLSVQAAIDQPRVHSQGAQTFIDSRVPAATREELAELGHELIVQALTPGELPFARVSAIAAVDGVLYGGSGPAWSTAAGSL